MDKNSKTIVSVQALRAAAALSVVLVHFSIGYSRLTLGDGHSGIYEFGAGVDVFFVISGFIMFHSSHSLFGKPGASVIFLRNRIARIVPLYWAATTLAIWLWIGFHGVSVKAALGSYFFVPYTAPPGNFGPLYGLGWTLNCEMYFYVIFAGVLFFPRKLAFHWWHHGCLVPSPSAVFYRCATRPSSSGRTL